MLGLSRHQELCRQFAALLTYPSAQMAAEAAACAGALTEISPGLGGAVGRFAAYAAANSPERVEEDYTAVFELQALCHPYVGYQLCGENQQRTFFMLRLREIYRQHAFEPGNELPDHFAEVLRFIGATDDRVCREELIADGLLPALDKCLAGIDNDQRPYLDLLRGVRDFLAGTAEAGRHMEASS